MKGRGEGRKKPFSERIKTASRFRTSKKGRTSPRKKPDRSVKGGERIMATIGMDRYGGHDHSKATGCTASCPKYMTSSHTGPLPEEVNDAEGQDGRD